jgi:DNA-binding LacI/PurR family transcriptional regulator
MLKYKENELYKYNKLISELRKAIFSGKFNKNGKLPPERKLAELFGYSRITIRTALQQLKEEGLIEQFQGRGTFVKQSELKDSVVDKKKYMICCICIKADVDIDVDPYFSQIFLGFHRAKGDLPVELETIALRSSEKFCDYIDREKISLSRWDGLIFINYSLQDSEIVFLNNSKTKFVVMGEHRSKRRIPMVDMDNFDGPYQAVNHLLEIGRKSPVFMHSNPETCPWTHRRLAGFREALKENGITWDARMEIEVDGLDQDDATEKMEKLIKSGYNFDSLIVCGDWATLGAVNKIKECNLRIPEDIAVITYDKCLWLLSGITPKLTFMTQPFSKMAEQAVKMLIGLFSEDSDIIPITILKPILTVRDSTKSKNN